MNIVEKTRISVVFFCILTGICLISAYIVNHLGIHWLQLLFLIVIIWFLSMWSVLLASPKISNLFISYQTNYKLSVEPTEQLSSGDTTDSTNIDHLMKTIEEYCLASWFPKISKDPRFIEHSTLIIRDVLRKVFKVQTPANSKLLIYSIFCIYLRHLKEYKRAMTKMDKNEYKITTKYRYVHLCTNCPEKYSYFLYHLTMNFMNRFTNWELRNSLPCHVVHSIVARKFLNQIIQTYIDPKCINYYILNLCVSQRSQLLDYSYVAITDKQFQNEEKEPVQSVEKNDTEQVSSVVEAKQDKVQPVPQNKKDENKETKLTKSKEQVMPINKPKDETVPVTKEAKVPESKSKPHPTLSETHEAEPLCHREMPEDIQYVKSKQNSGIPDTGKKKLLEEMRSSMKPLSGATMNTLQSFKDLHQQTLDTVMKPMSQATSTALHKIGDLQDEAVDVVEGIIDFGKAGFRKGLLQFSALQEQSSKLDTFTEGNDTKNVEKHYNGTTDSTSVKPVEGLPHQHAVDYSTDVNDGKAELKHPKFLPVISMNLLEPTDSPDPEYEETADLASTIAKLRTLLQQKSSESSMSTPAVSPMPPDDLSEVENVTYADEDNGMMPTFYKFCAKTATGVLHNTLNTIKTALPGNTIDGEYLNANKWNYVEAEDSNNLLLCMNKLLSERKAFCTVDNAYEAIESLKESDEQIFPCILQIEDDLDDFEMKVPVSKLLMDIVCELMTETDSLFIQEPVVKLILVLFGPMIQERIVNTFHRYIQKLITTYRYTPSKKIGEILSFSLEDFVKIFIADLPGVVVHVIGEDNLEKAVTLFVSSLQYKEMNQDMILQFCELVCLSSVENSFD